MWSIQNKPYLLFEGYNKGNVKYISSGVILRNWTWNNEYYTNPHFCPQDLSKEIFFILNLENIRTFLNENSSSLYYIKNKIIAGNDFYWVLNNSI